MAHFEQDVTPQMQLRINGCGGDVRITGHEPARIAIEGNVELERFMEQDNDGLTITGYPEDLMIMLPHQASVEVHGAGGDVEVGAVAEVRAQALHRLAAHSIGGDLRIKQVPKIEIGAVGGDVEIHGTSETVEISHVGGDLELDRASYLSLKAVGGDANLENIDRLNDLGHIGGDLRLKWRGEAEGDIRGIVGGDIELELPDRLDLTLVAVVGGDIHGSGHDWTMRRGAGRHQVVFGAGTRQLFVTAGGDIEIKGGTEAQQMGGSGDWGEMRGTMDAFGEEMRGLGRELEELGRNLARELSGLGRDIAREVRVAGRDAQRSMKEDFKSSLGRPPRVRMRVNDREFNFDPEQIERIKREARAAAASGIARAQEAVEQALKQWQQGPNPPRGPQPPRPPQPPRGGYTGQTVRIDRESDEPEAPQAAAQPRDVDAERLAILRMVHEGRLAPDEAELLLRGLEDRA